MLPASPKDDVDGTWGIFPLCCGGHNVVIDDFILLVLRLTWRWGILPKILSPLPLSSLARNFTLHLNLLYREGVSVL